ncbi:hypothetical protein DA83_01575 [Pseudomonas sp. 250J]|uniref:DUF3077 domain-containing protein n=1 Tax=Pseudomonas peradeniyensis TaxID=2745488 RepID=A0ABT2VBG9_9PSED|nr:MULTISPECIES: hypothetical protein [Pseudomonas]KNX77362.1 hypothetical protein DA83_01575 [Pseudomonas sp. 250J]MCU7239056.1 hypothetical protein [Pseudomonas peradeniyensis]MCU7283224.1 hypothetical protein [Pseudomonas peradeniyensis]QZA56551.1 hypothetical protein K2O50_11105 [Pseudomonas sp. 2hn]
MLKIAPDPLPSTESPHLLEDTLFQAYEYVMCALAVAHQLFSHLPKSPATLVMLTMMHELDATRMLLESALAQLQMSERPPSYTLH